MSAETRPAEAQAGESSCWCCGQIRSEHAMVHLGLHPEVGVCFNCARYLRRRALDHQARQRPVIGPAFKWVDRHLPW